MRGAPIRPVQREEIDPQVQNKGGDDVVPIGLTPLTEGTTRLPGIMKKEEIAGHH